MAASPTPKTIHGASTIRSIPVIRVALHLPVLSCQCTRWPCGPREADMVTVWRRAARRARGGAVPGGGFSGPGRYEDHGNVQTCRAGGWPAEGRGER